MLRIFSMLCLFIGLLFLNLSAYAEPENLTAKSNDSAAVCSAEEKIIPADCVKSIDASKPSETERLSNATAVLTYTFAGMAVFLTLGGFFAGFKIFSSVEQKIERIEQKLESSMTQIRHDNALQIKYGITNQQEEFREKYRHQFDRLLNQHTRKIASDFEVDFIEILNVALAYLNDTASSGKSISKSEMKQYLKIMTSGHELLRQDDTDAVVHALHQLASIAEKSKENLIFKKLLLRYIQDLYAKDRFHSDNVDVKTALENVCKKCGGGIIPALSGGH